MKVRNFKVILRNQYGSELFFINLDNKPTSKKKITKVPSYLKTESDGVERIHFDIKKFYDLNRDLVYKHKSKPVL